MLLDALPQGRVGQKVVAKHVLLATFWARARLHEPVADARVAEANDMRVATGQQHSRRQTIT